MGIFPCIPSLYVHYSPSPIYFHQKIPQKSSPNISQVALEMPIPGSEGEGPGPRSPDKAAESSEPLSSSAWLWSSGAPGDNGWKMAMDLWRKNVYNNAIHGKMFHEWQNESFQVSLFQIGMMVIMKKHV